MNKTGFGQITGIFNAINMQVHSLVQGVTQSIRLRGEQKLAKRELELQEKLQTMDAASRERDYEISLSVSKRKDQLYKDIAVYAGISIATIATILVVGILLVSYKGENNDV